MIYLKFAQSEYSDSVSLHKLARATLYKLLYDAFGEKFVDSDIVIAAGGKPYIKAAAFDFSYAHTKNAVVTAAVGNGKNKEGLICIDINAQKIGVDIEPADRELKNKDIIIEKLFSEKEKEYVRTNKNRRFLEVWTKKESILKATGEGLSGFSKTDTYSFNGKYIDTKYVNIGDKEYIVSLAAI